jgi:hypothetical protein
MREWLRETGGTLLSAVLWLVGVGGGFIAMGFLTHFIVEGTISATSASWRAVAGAVAAMLLVACAFAMLLILGKGMAIIPDRRRRRKRRSQL